MKHVIYVAAIVAAPRACFARLLAALHTLTTIVLGFIVSVPWKPKQLQNQITVLRRVDAPQCTMDSYVLNIYPNGVIFMVTSCNLHGCMLHIYKIAVQELHSHASVLYQHVIGSLR